MDDPDGYFGEPVAASYDDSSDPMFQPAAIDPAVSLLAELAGGGQALELAIGTGRIGLPLSGCGVPVHGIELSRAMLARLQANHAIQQYRGHYVTFTDGIGQYRTTPFRYVWPSELDLMAQLAGLRRRDRWAGWNRAPFTSDSSSHVSVWQKPER